MSAADLAALTAEAEYVQSFANPGFVQALARRGELSDAAAPALRALLARWSAPERAAALRYPLALEMLRLAAESAPFRAAAAGDAFTAAVRAAQYGHWAEGSPVGAPLEGGAAQ